MVVTLVDNDCNLLVVDGDSRVRARVKDILADLCTVHEASGWEEALAMLAGVSYQVLLTAVILPDGDGIELCARSAINSPHTIRIVSHPSPTVEIILASINHGHAWKLIQTPCEHEELRQTVRDALVSAACLTPDDEVELRVANKELRRKVASRTRDVVALNEELRHVYDSLQIVTPVDSVTGLYNRRAMQERLEVAVRLARRYQQKLACVVCDIDGFGDYNETYGHDAGDMLLVELANWLQKMVRDVDITCRIGNDCFTLILPNTDSAQAAQLVDRMRQKIMDFSVPGKCKPLQLNFGISEVVEGTCSADDLLRTALDAEKKSRASRSNPMN